MATDNDRGDRSIIAGLETLIDRLGSWVEEDREIRRTVEFGEGDSQAIFSVHMRSGIGDGPRSAARRSAETPRSEAATTASRPAAASRAPTPVDVRRSRTPTTEIFDEGDHLRVIAEMPGVVSEDIRVEAVGDVLSLQAESSSHRYDTEVLLSADVCPDPTSIEVRNGVAEIVLTKQDDAESACD